MSLQLEKKQMIQFANFIADLLDRDSEWAKRYEAETGKSPWQEERPEKQEKAS